MFNDQFEITNYQVIPAQAGIQKQLEIGSWLLKIQGREWRMAVR
jgi:hypothetical protein